MAKIKVNIDRKDPSPETIEKFKNYKKIQNNLVGWHTFHGLKNLFFKDRRALIVLMILLLYILGWLLLSEFPDL
jgi:hypothetical protein